MAENELVVVFTSQNQAEARIVQAMLETGGLAAVLLDGFASGSVGGFGPAIPVRVAVPAGQAKTALEMISSAPERAP